MSFWTEKIEFPELGRIKELTKKLHCDGKYHYFKFSEIEPINILILKLFMDKAEIAYKSCGERINLDGIDLVQKIAILDGSYGRKHS